MPYALNWIVVAALLAGWSLVAWLLHAVGVWTVSGAGALSGAASELGALRLPDALGVWLPPVIAQDLAALLSGAAGLVAGLLQAAPALAGGVTVAAWSLWGLGSLLLLVLGAGSHLLIALWRRHAAGRGPGPTLAAG